MTAWIMLFAACAVACAAGFTAVRARSAPFRRPVLPQEPAGAAPAAEAPQEVVAPHAPAQADGRPPSVARPDDGQLALWASQVAAGTRKMTIATDGCRVTWNRSCKHGHPSWLVYLDYVSR